MKKKNRPDFRFLWSLKNRPSQPPFILGGIVVSHDHFKLKYLSACLICATPSDYCLSSELVEMIQCHNCLFQCLFLRVLQRHDPFFPAVDFVSPSNWLGHSMDPKCKRWGHGRDDYWSQPIAQIPKCFSHSSLNSGAGKNVILLAKPLYFSLSDYCETYHLLLGFILWPVAFQSRKMRLMLECHIGRWTSLESQNTETCWCILYCVIPFPFMCHMKILLGQGWICVFHLVLMLCLMRKVAFPL